MFINKYYFDSYGCRSPVNITNPKNKGTYSEYQIQKTDSFAQRIAYTFYILQK